MPRMTAADAAVAFVTPSRRKIATAASAAFIRGIFSTPCVRFVRTAG